MAKCEKERAKKSYVTSFFVTFAENQLKWQEREEICPLSRGSR